MKFDHAWTSAGQPPGETPAPPPGKATPVLPRLPGCGAQPLVSYPPPRTRHAWKHVLCNAYGTVRAGLPAGSAAYAR
jgi:hypothetical protein